MTNQPKDSTRSLSIAEREAGDVTILDLEGNVILGSGSNQLKEALERLINAGKKKLLLNFAGVKYLDSSGVGVLVSGASEMNSTGSQLKLLNLPEKVVQVLTLSSLLSMFEVYDDEAQAIKDFK